MIVDYTKVPQIYLVCGKTDLRRGIDVFCKSFIHNIAKKKYITLQPEFFFNYFDFDNAFLSLKLSPVKLRMCA